MFSTSIRSPQPTRAFTMIELVIVIGILTLLMGLTIGSIASMGRKDALTASKQLVTDMIRQARHTARSSRAPVMITISKDDRSIAGFVRTPVFSTGFEAPSSADIEEQPYQIFDVDGNELNRNIYGYTGQGIEVGLTKTQPILTELKKNRLSRPDTVGFFLSCSVKVPLAPHNIIPLLMIGTSSDPTGSTLSDFHSMNHAIAGLCLISQTSLIQSNSGLQVPLLTPQGDTPPPLPPSVTTEHYELFGWLGDGTSGGPGSLPQYFVSNLDRNTRVNDLNDTTKRSHDSVEDNPLSPLDGWDFSNVILGGKWIEVGMLYDGKKLTLFVNGARVGENDEVNAPIWTIGSSVDEAIVVGSFVLDGTPHIASRCIFDNIRIDRLGTAKSQTFPQGVTPKEDYQLTILPDGRLEFTTGSSGTITLTNSHGTSSTTLTVTADGRVEGDIQPQGQP